MSSIRYSKSRIRSLSNWKLPASGVNGSAYSFVGNTCQTNTGHYWTPDSYATSGRDYPILYGFHGKSSTSTAFASQVLPWLKAAIAASQIREVVFVMPNTGNTWSVNSYTGVTPREFQIVNDVVPFFDRHLRSSYRRIITGFSMGGFSALRLAIKYQNLFLGVCAYGCPNLDADSNNNWNSGDLTDFNTYWGGSIDRLRIDSPCASIGGNGLAEVNASSLIARNYPIRLVDSAADPAIGNSVANFNDVLTNLGIPHSYTDLVDIDHNAGDYYEADDGDGFAFLEGEALV